MAPSVCHYVAGQFGARVDKRACKEARSSNAMPITETACGVTDSQPSRLRTELNIAAAVVAIGICLVILALLANTPAPAAAHHAGPRTHTHARAVAATRAASWS
jgi:hypothetical protein